MKTKYCHHCHTLMTEEEFDSHYSGVLAPLQADRIRRGGIYVTVDGDEYWAPSVEELRRAGFKVVLRHRRMKVRKKIVTRRDILMWGLEQISPKGGSTYVLLLAPDGYWAEGRVHCSNKDTYSKKVGWVLACCKALSELPGELYDFDQPFIEAVQGLREA